LLLLQLLQLRRLQQRQHQAAHVLRFQQRPEAGARLPLTRSMAGAPGDQQHVGGAAAGRRVQQLIQRRGGLRQARRRLLAGRARFNSATILESSARFSSATIFDSSLSYSLMRYANSLIEAADLLRHPYRLEDARTLLGVEADYYIAAGDQVTWGKGLERCGRDSADARRQGLRAPGNHESADQIAGMCARYGLHDFHERHFQAGRWHIAGLGYSNPTPFNTPGEYSEPQLAARLQRFADLLRWCWSATRRPTAPRSTRSPRPARRLHRGARFHVKYQPEYFFCGHIHEAEGRLHRDRQDARPQRRQGRVFVRIGLNPMTLEELDRAYLPLRDQALAVRRYL
jgi:hypothetical protein